MLLPVRIQTKKLTNIFHFYLYCLIIKLWHYTFIFQGCSRYYSEYKWQAEERWIMSRVPSPSRGRDPLLVSGSCPQKMSPCNFWGNQKCCSWCDGTTRKSHHHVRDVRGEAQVSGQNFFMGWGQIYLWVLPKTTCAWHHHIGDGSSGFPRSHPTSLLVSRKDIWRPCAGKRRGPGLRRVKEKRLEKSTGFNLKILFH